MHTHSETHTPSTYVNTYWQEISAFVGRKHFTRTFSYVKFEVSLGIEAQFCSGELILFLPS